MMAMFRMGREEWDTRGETLPRRALESAASYQIAPRIRPVRACLFTLQFTKGLFQVLVLSTLWPGRPTLLWDNCHIMGKSPSPLAGNTRPAPRFYVPDTLSPGSQVQLPERVARHIAVLRLSAGAPVTLFNGRAGQYRALLQSPDRNRCAARVTEYQDVACESALNVTLAQCLSAGDRMDMTLQKATELGVSVIVPLESERSVVRLSPERALRRLDHWRNVVIAACEQCGRNHIPEVQPLSELLPWLAQAPAGLRLVLDPDSGSGMASLPAAAPEAVTLLIGAEGGFAPHERAAAQRCGFQPLRLGPRVLRTETTPLAALAALQTRWGDFQ